MYQLTDREEWLCQNIKDSAYTVHKALGPGLLEQIYEVCFCHELKKRGIEYERQVRLPIYYDGLVFDEGFRMDVLVEDTIICELKAVDKVNPIWEAQILSHLRLSTLNIGFLINFNIVLLKDGIRRYCVEN